jgi:hypothetical protein
LNTTRNNLGLARTIVEPTTYPIIQNILSINKRTSSTYLGLQAFISYLHLDSVMIDN